jgi:hypothetical protein
MQASSPPPNRFNTQRINIKRGKKLYAPNGAVDFLRSNDKIAPLLPTLRRNASLQRDCGTALPAMFDSCEVLQLADDQLTLSAPNAALASRLKQQLPKLQLFLQQRGWQINAIRIKVQVRKVPEKSITSRPSDLPGLALQAFDQLEQSLEKTPQNDALRAAIQHLLQKRR